MMEIYVGILAVSLVGTNVCMAYCFTRICREFLRSIREMHIFEASTKGDHQTARLFAGIARDAGKEPEKLPKALRESSAGEKDSHEVVFTQRG